MKRDIKVWTSICGTVSVPVLVYGDLGVQPQVLEDRGRPYLSKNLYGVVHLATGALITNDDWTLDQAKVLAQELSRLRGWERIPAVDMRRPEAKDQARRAVGEDFRNQVRAILARHRARRRGRR